MKKGIHPDYHEIEVEETDGSKFVIRSTYGSPGSRMKLYVDPKNHSAWTGSGKSAANTRGRGSEFRDKFKGFDY